MRLPSNRIAVFLFTINLLTPAAGVAAEAQEHGFDVFLAEVNSSSQTTKNGAAPGALLFLDNGPLASDIPLHVKTLPGEIPSLALTLPEAVVAKMNQSIADHAPLKLVLMQGSETVFSPVVRETLTSNELQLTFSSRSEYLRVKRLLESS